MTSGVGGRSAGSGVGVTSFGTPVTGIGGGASVASASAIAEPPKNSVVQFMWQPLTEMSYPRVTLLASFKVGGSVGCCVADDQVSEMVV